MSRRRHANSSFSYSNLEDRRLLANDVAGINLVEDTRTLHIRPVEHTGLDMPNFVSEILVEYNSHAEEIVVTEHLPEVHSPTSVNLSGHLTRVLIFNRSEIDNLVYIGTPGNDLFSNNSPLSSFIRGGNGDDFLVGSWMEDRIFGDGGNDRIQGGRGNDTIRGASGDDSIYGGGGDDVLIGDAGNDTINGGMPGVVLASGPTDKDIIFGGDGDDILEGNEDDDRIYGHGGRDYIRGGAGNDVSRGGDGDDWILEISVSGEATENQDTGNDFLYGGNGNDELMGGRGNDRIFGQAGDDLIGDTTRDLGNNSMVTIDLLSLNLVAAESGDDFVDGGEGDDLIYGGLDDDRIRGGEGDDIISGSSSSHSPLAARLHWTRIAR